MVSGWFRPPAGRRVAGIARSSGRAPHGVGHIRGLVDRPIAFLAAVLLMLALIPAVPARSQEFVPPTADQPVALVADRITVESETGRVIAEGSVEVYYGQRTLTADRIVYNDKTGRISASGPVTLRDPTGVTVFADAAELDADLVDGLVSGARSVMGEHIRLAAVEARRIDERYNTLSKAVYSPCKVCAEDPTPLWRIRARRVIHDEEKRIIHYEDATFDVLGIPVAWLPYFRHPDPTVKRASGFLVPQFQSSSKYGYGLKVPYYLVIDEQSDLTFVPFVMTRDAPILELEYRRAFESGEIRVSGSGTVNDYLGPSQFHGHFDSEGTFRTTDGISWGWDITVASDDPYLRRFDFPYPDRLTSELYARRYEPSGFFDVSGVYFQSLRVGEPAGDIPRGLPVFDGRYNLDDPLFGGRIGLVASSHSLFRNEGRDVTRLSLGGDWERQSVLDWGLSLTAFAGARGDLFIYDSDPVLGNGTEARLTGLAGVEARFPLITDAYAGFTHMFEPIVQAIVAPYGGNGSEIPVEDSLVTEFDETNLIDRNRFSGLDNVEEGPRLNVMLRYELLSENSFMLDASVGRVFRFRPQDDFSIGSGLRDADSDYVAAWSAGYLPYFQMRHRLRIDDTGSITRNEVFGSVAIDPVQLTTSYLFYASDPEIGAATDREEVTGVLNVGLTDNWSFSAFAQRDLFAGASVQFGGSVTYANECCAIEVRLRRQETGSVNDPASTSVNVQLKLFTLGADNEG